MNIIQNNLQKNMYTLKNMYNLKSIYLIGSGGFKQVFKIQKNNTFEILKFIPIKNNGESQQTQIKRIQQEINTLKDCNSCFLVKLGSIGFDLQDIKGNKYIIYSEEFLPGKDLDKSLKEKITFNWIEIRKIFYCICEALSELHEKHIIHRDIKPENIIKLEDSKRSYVLIDLGIVFNKETGGLTTRQQQGSMGTPGYIAPELSTPYYKKNINTQSDIYSLGITIYELITGRKPMKVEDIHSVQGFPEQLFELLKECIKNIPYLRPKNIMDIYNKIKEIE